MSTGVDSGQASPIQIFGNMNTALMKDKTYLPHLPHFRKDIFYTKVVDESLQRSHQRYVSLICDF